MSNSVNSCGTLRKAQLPRVEFDPTDKLHLESANQFLKTGNWGKINFHIEVPFTTVPETVLRKLAAHFISTQIENNS